MSPTNREELNTSGDDRYLVNDLNSTLRTNTSLKRHANYRSQIDLDGSIKQ